MLVFKYKAHQTVVIDGVEQPQSDKYVSTSVVPYSEESYAKAKEIAIEISEPYDNGQPDPADIPTEMDKLDARLTYIEMMTGLMEV